MSDEAETESVFRVIFIQDDDRYEIYAKSLTEETLMGFIEVEEILFSPVKTVVVDPSEERLRLEFKGVKRSYIPMHNVLRIDEMHETGAPRIKQKGDGSNVSQFPGAFQGGTQHDTGQSLEKKK